MGEKPTSRKHPSLSSEEIAIIRRNPPAMMDVRTVSVYLDQSERKTRDDIRLRRIPHLRLGGKILVRTSDLHRALEAMVVREL